MLTRRTAMAVLVLPALAVVVLAARSYRPFGGEADSERAASTTLLDGAFTVIVVLGSLLLVILLLIRLRAPGSVGKRGGPSPLIGFLVYVVVICAAVFMARTMLHIHPPEAASKGSDGAFPLQKPPGAVTPETPLQRGPHVVWPLAAGLGALIAAAAITAVVISRRRRGGDRAHARELERLAAALDEAIDDLRRDPDPRRAVVAAYARMEQALTVYGLPRAPAEAPFEYLGRVAKVLDAEESVAALTELFEVAKFSEHTIDEPMRSRAIDALSAVREEVRAAA